MRELCTRGAVKALAEEARRRAAAAIFMMIIRRVIDSLDFESELTEEHANAGEAKLLCCESHFAAMKNDAHTSHEGLPALKILLTHNELNPS